MHWLLFIHKILFSSTCFEPQVLIFRRIQLYRCSIWYCHPLWEVLVACRYTLKLCTERPPETLIESDSTICCMYTTVSSWRWALEVGGLSVHSLSVYRQATRNSHREWQYHMLHVYNCILLKMNAWGSKIV